MDIFSKDKTIRILHIYSELIDGYVVNKTDTAQKFGVNERTIQRDIDDIRNFFDIDSDRTGIINSVIYDREKGGYCLEQLYRLRLKNSEVLLQSNKYQLKIITDYQGVHLFTDYF